jgi:hypothetical protein
MPGSELTDHGVPDNFFIELNGERGVYKTGMAGIHQGNGTVRGTKAHLLVHLDTAVIVAEFSPDQLAVTAEREPRDQFFLYVPGEDGNRRLKATGKTVYQIFDFFFQKNVDFVHVREGITF